MVAVPNVWPLGNIYNIWMLDPKAAPKTTSQGAWYFELIVRYLRLSTYVLLTLFQYQYLFPKDLSICKNFTADWVAMVYARNLCIGWLLYGGWHWILYVSPLKANLEGKKFNKVDQYRKGTSNLSREMFYTTQGLAIGATYEVLMMHLWGTGRVPYATDFWSTPLSSVLWVLFVGYWREFHFFWIHRWMHFEPIYKHVHALHHRSYNPGPWSGLSMHPIEHLFYYACTVIPTCLILQHPFHFIYSRVHCDFSPLPGHDGFDQPAGGSYYHYLHHAHFNCNYGTPMVPLDKLLGYYNDGSEYRRKQEEAAARKEAQAAQ